MQQADTKPGLYYVTIHDGRRHARLLGPFVDNHQAALDMVDAVWEKALELNPTQAAFASFGTARWEPGTKPFPGILNSYFNLEVTNDGNQ